MDSASTKSRETRCRALWPAVCALLLAGSAACGDLLGIPGAPRLIQEEPTEAEPFVVEVSSDTGAAPRASLSGVIMTAEAEPAAGADGVLPAAGLGLSPTMPVPDEPGRTSDLPLQPEPPPSEPCVETSLPTDLILILDNSGSMDAETAAVERSLFGWSQRLATLGLDYRLILLSRHRTRDRSDSGAASTSICVEQPLSGLARCPSAVPVLGERFFHYSIKIDASDSFEQALAGFAAPDPARLAPEGWSEWLRAGALKAFIEISDADAALPAAQFVTRLEALGPQLFPSRDGAGTPGFLFYSVVGLAEKATPNEAYGPDEPIERTECSSADTSPDNAGEQYQALSVLTGGLRLSLCRVDALGEHLGRIADDVALQARRCVLRDSALRAGILPENTAR
jgi:hypothetical protein